MDNNKRMIASLALFRNLYNEGRSDVMTILCEFVKNVVFSKHLTGFTATQIKNELKQEYEFYIPEYVVESVIRKFCRKDNAKYYPNEDSISQQVSSEQIERIERSHEIIHTQLVGFVEKKISKTLSEEEREKLFQSFCSFIIEESDVEYSPYISTFILEAQTNAELSTLIQTIKEGVVLYTGIQYNDTINEIGSWKDEFTIYAEQEILFHLAGLNGTLYQQLYSDFAELIKEVNHKAGKQLIKVKYFDSVKNEIEKFFNVAERIVDGKETLDCSNIAMASLVQGCDHKSDIVAKKVAFYKLLKDNKIDEESKNLFSEDASKYNIFYQENITKLSEDLPNRDIEWSLRLLNYISLIRRGTMSGFEKSKCILLTGNSTTIAVAFHSNIKLNGEVPLATTLDYMTNKLWFKMNKGFGQNAYPKSFDIVTKAQIVLSTQVAGSVAQEFEKIKQEIATKSKSEDVIVAELAELKSRVRKPEDVHKSEIDEILSTIAMADTERYLREREIERANAQQQKEENQRLQNEIEEKKDIILQKEETNQYYKSQLVKSHTLIIEQLENQINEIENKQKDADEKIDKRIRKIRWIPWTIIVLWILLVVLLTYVYGWDKIEPIISIVPILIAALPYLCFAIGTKSVNPQNLIDIKYRKYYKNKIYNQHSVDLSKIELLKQQKATTEQKLNETM